MILGCLLLFCIQFIANMVMVVLPTIALDLNLSAEMLNAITLAFLITFVSLMLPFGKFASKKGIGIPQIWHFIDDGGAVAFSFFNRHQYSFDFSSHLGSCNRNH